GVRRGKRLERSRAAAERLQLEADGSQIVLAFGDTGRRGGRELQDDRREQDLHLRAPVGGRAAQALVVHALVGGVLIDENQAARAFADEVGAVELAEVAKAGEEGGGGDQRRLGPGTGGGR